MKEQNLNLEETLYFDVDSQFMFERTFYRPSEFPARLDLYDKGQPSYYWTLAKTRQKKESKRELV